MSKSSKKKEYKPKIYSGVLKVTMKDVVSITNILHKDYEVITVRFVNSYSDEKEINHLIEIAILN